MTKDQQFLDAMRNAVAQNPDMVAPGAYQREGAAYCIVGKVMWDISPALCPADNSLMAFDLLTKNGASAPVAAAFEVAQYLNDYRFPWRIVGKYFERALAEYKAWPPSAHSRDSRQRMALKMTSLANTECNVHAYRGKGKISGGVVKAISEDLDKISAEIKSFNAAMTGLATAATTIPKVTVNVGAQMVTGGFSMTADHTQCEVCNPQIAYAKQDHALTA